MSSHFLFPAVVLVATAVAAAERPAIRKLDLPEQGFFAKALDFRGIPIKAHQVVADEALTAAYDRLHRMLRHQPVVVQNLKAAGVELHVIGRDQATTDLPEWRHDKGRPLAEYGGLTRDERTRGMGGRLVSCGEENLLGLDDDRYFGRDICVHEFAHAIRTYGMGPKLQRAFDKQLQTSVEQGRWAGSYAATNADEYFAELSMWYFGTHGDLGMKGEPPHDGPAGLEAYDPAAYELFDDFYAGRRAATPLALGPRR